MPPLLRTTTKFDGILQSLQSVDDTFLAAYGSVPNEIQQIPQENTSNPVWVSAGHGSSSTDFSTMLHPTSLPLAHVGLGHVLDTILEEHSPVQAPPAAVNESGQQVAHGLSPIDEAAQPALHVNTEESQSDAPTPAVTPVEHHAAVTDALAPAISALPYEQVAHSLPAKEPEVVVQPALAVPHVSTVQSQLSVVHSAVPAKTPVEHNVAMVDGAAPVVAGLSVLGEQPLDPMQHSPTLSQEHESSHAAPAAVKASSGEAVPYVNNLGSQSAMSSTAAASSPVEHAAMMDGFVPAVPVLSVPGEQPLAAAQLLLAEHLAEEEVVMPAPNNPEANNPEAILAIHPAPKVTQVLP